MKPTRSTERDGRRAAGGEKDRDVDDASLIALGRAVIETEAEALTALVPRIDTRFAEACRLLLACRGRVVVCGIGKSGHIGAKLAATLASTGTAAFFVHAAEAAHGDLGMLRPGDVVVALSHSGGSDELLVLLPGIRRLGVPLVSLCGEPDSPLARASSVVLDTRVSREACPLGLAPTASTSVTLAMGDALAIALLGARGFGAEDFALAHPGGRLGRRLLLRVGDIMVTGEAVPRVPRTVRLADALVEIGRRGLGMTCVIDATDTPADAPADAPGSGPGSGPGRGPAGTSAGISARPPAPSLVGVFTDGDLRRSLERGADIREVELATLMTRAPRTTTSDTLAVAALETMQAHRITSLPVVDAPEGARQAGARGDARDGELVGVVTMHALLGAGVA